MGHVCVSDIEDVFVENPLSALKKGQMVEASVLGSGKGEEPVLLSLRPSLGGSWKGRKAAKGGLPAPQKIDVSKLQKEEAVSGCVL